MSEKQDELLLDGVNEYGRNWQHIKSVYFPRRTSLGAKNRYHLLRRKLEGARSYAISPFPKASSASSGTVDESLGKDIYDLFESQDETDENKLKENDPISAQRSPSQDRVSNSGLGKSTNVPPDSCALEADLGKEFSGGKPDLAPVSWPYGKLADNNNPTRNHTPFSNVDILDYANVAPNTARTKQPFEKAVAIAPMPPSTFGDNANFTTQNMDDFTLNTMKFSPAAGATCCWEDQARFESEMLFSNEPRMLGLDPAFASNHTPTAAAVVQFSSDVAGTITPVATPTSHAQACCLSPRDYQPSYSATEDKFTRDPTATTRRITIEAVCLEQHVGTMVQAVTDLSLWAVFKSDD